jgi:hypothetical protein
MTKMLSGLRNVWMALWTFADWNTSAPPPIFPSNKAIRERAGGIGESTLQGHLSKLKAIGWIRESLVNGRRQFELAWVTPFCVDTREEPPEIRAPATNIPIAGNPEDTPEYPDPPLRNPGGAPPDIQTHTLQEPIKYPPKPRSEARARDRDINAVAKPAQRAIECPQERLQSKRNINVKRNANSKRDGSNPRRALTPEHEAAVLAVGEGRWSPWLRRDNWVTALAETVHALNLTPEQVATVLEAWDRGADALGGPLAAAKLSDKPEDGGPQPSARALWWDRWRPWVAEQLAPDGDRLREPGNTRSKTPISCGWAENTPKVPIFGEPS